jgi:hypothetical protein
MYPSGAAFATSFAVYRHWSGDSHDYGLLERPIVPDLTRHTVNRSRQQAAYHQLHWFRGIALPLLLSGRPETGNTRALAAYAARTSDLIPIDLLIDVSRGAQRPQ